MTEIFVLGAVVGAAVLTWLVFAISDGTEP